MMENYMRYRDNGKCTELYFLVIASTIEEISELMVEADAVEVADKKDEPFNDRLVSLSTELSDTVAMFNLLDDICNEVEANTNFILNSIESSSVTKRMVAREHEEPGLTYRLLRESANMLIKHLCKMSRFGPNSVQPLTGLLTKNLVSTEYQNLVSSTKAFLKVMGHPMAIVDHSSVSRKMEKFDMTLIESFEGGYTVIK